MITAMFHLEIHHGGEFRRRKGLKYCNGSVNELLNVDPDMFCWFDLDDAVRDLGYGGEHKIYFKQPGEDLEKNLILLWNDASIRALNVDSL